MKDFRERVAVVTGASSGIGLVNNAGVGLVAPVADIRAYRASSRPRATATATELSLYGVATSYLTTLRWGGSFPWEDEPGTITVGCPDCDNQVIWHLQIIE